MSTRHPIIRPRATNCGLRLIEARKAFSHAQPFTAACRIISPQPLSFVAEQRLVRLRGLSSPVRAVQLSLIHQLK